ncbi:MAG: hypothetical protein ACRDOI_16685, partial [Trebonia sp.]
MPWRARAEPPHAQARPATPPGVPGEWLANGATAALGRSGRFPPARTGTTTPLGAKNRTVPA